MDIWSSSKLFVFILFVIPGFVSLKTYSTILPASQQKSSDRLIDAIAYSCINYGFTSPLIFFIYYLKMWSDHLFLFWILCFVILFIFPVVIVFAFLKIRSSNFGQQFAPHPTVHAWDFVFGKRESMWVVATLVDSSKVAGLYGINSFSSSGSSNGSIYLEESWVINDCGGFERIKESSSGVLIVGDMIKYLEFFNCYEDDVL